MQTPFLSAIGGLLAAVILAVSSTASAQDDSGRRRTRLFVREVPISVLGKTAKVIAIEQEDGAHGLSVDQQEGFHVEVINKLPDPTSIHWHGLILPNLMDGVPFVTQNPIQPGESFSYDFPLKQSGSYWMHSHYGLQEQLLNSAPLIIRSPAQAAAAEEQFVVMLSDFSFTPPSQILSKLKGGMKTMKAARGEQKMAMPESKEMLVSQVWDETAKRFISKTIEAALPDIDVTYDSLLANRRTLDDPEVLSVRPGQAILLRLIAASAASNFFIDTGKLDAQIVATDGEGVQPIHGNFFQLAVAQRLDILVKIPEGGGAFPIVALGEGTALQTGVVLATEGAAIPKLSVRAALKAGALDNTQELRLVASNPLSERQIDRSLPSTLGGAMSDYVWTINGEAYPNRNALNVKEGERVEVVIKNETAMSHPMHLHGHVFQVTEIDGSKIRGARRDTVLVPPKSTIKFAFDADNPGVWAYHCHILYHLVTGMFTVVLYDGADTKFWQPDKALSEL